MKKFLIGAGVVGSSVFLPLIASAATITSIGDFAATITGIINNVVVPLILTIAFLVFIWGVFKFFIAGGEEGKKEGRDLIIYGLIGFFVILSVWGLVNVVRGTFDLRNNVTPNDLPKAPCPTDTVGRIFGGC